jgi:N-acetylglucosaminyldiphosphoundecaprenol N-acetyl-beta-D-mannosaminyltransferase
MSPATAAPERIEIAGVRIDACTLEETVDRVIEHAAARGAPAFVVTPNAHHVVMLQESEPFREVYREAWLSVADGVPLVWASRLLRTPLPGRVNGTDLFEAVCAAAAGRGLRVFLLGGRPGAADAAARVLRERHPDLQLAGTYCPPFGFERDAGESARVVEAVREARPDILFVGLGAPKQEIWMRENGEAVGVPVSLGIGVSFELVAGVVQRAPQWMQRSGLEWFYRLRMEPGRLWKRYAVTNPRFVALVMRQYRRGR